MPSRRLPSLRREPPPSKQFYISCPIDAKGPVYGAFDTVDLAQDWLNTRHANIPWGVDNSQRQCVAGIDAWKHGTANKLKIHPDATFLAPD